MEPASDGRRLIAAWLSASTAPVVIMAVVWGLSAGSRTGLVMFVWTVIVGLPFSFALVSTAGLAGHHCLLQRRWVSAAHYLLAGVVGSVVIAALFWCMMTLVGPAGSGAPLFVAGFLTLGGSMAAALFWCVRRPDKAARV